MVEGPDRELQLELCDSLHGWGKCGWLEGGSRGSDPMDYTLHGILQARILEWVAFPFSRGSAQPRDQTQASSIASRFFTS